jgi:hypothetical protein
VRTGTYTRSCVAWTCSGEDEHEEMGPAALALGAGEVAAPFLGGPWSPSVRPCFVVHFLAEGPAAGHGMRVGGTTMAGCVATACQDLPYKGVGRWPLVDDAMDEAEAAA